MNCKNSCQKSAQAAYNNAGQAYVAAGTELLLLGTLITDTGISIDTQSGGFVVNNSGLYRFSFDVTSTPSEAGAQTVQLYNGTSAMPCAIATNTVAAAETITQHIETIVRLNTCCAIQPVISARISGAAGTINHVCASAVKLA